jgi:LPS export ABC transporter protein LptC
MINTSFHKKIFLQAAILCSCLWLFSCENDPKDIEDLTAKRIAVEEAKDITTFFSQDGRLKAKLLAPIMYRYQQDTLFVEFPRTLKVDFFDSTGKLESKLFARYGKYFETRSKILLRDSVFVYNIKGDTLRSEELWWDQNTQRFYTDKPAHVIRKGQNILGRHGMEASQDLRDVTFLNPFGTVIMPDSTQ